MDVMDSLGQTSEQKLMGGLHMSGGSQPKITNLEDLISAGEKAFNSGQIDQAKAFFEAALETNPGHAVGLNNLAVLCHHLGDLEQAEILFLRSAALAQNPADALINLSAIAWQQNNIPESTGYLERALEIEGETPRVLEQMSHLCESMGDPVSSAHLFRKARRKSQTRSTPWRGAFCEIDITPDLDEKSVELQGYFGRPRIPDSIKSPLKMQILMLEDAYRKRTLFVAADIFGFGPELVEAIRADAGVWGISPEAVVLNASHTHYGPGTVTHTVAGLGPFDRDYAVKLVAHVANALPALYQSLAPVELSYGQADAQIGFNRRLSVDGRIEMLPNEAGYYASKTPILKVENTSGRTLLMVNHGCHPTGLGADTSISADYPGEMRATLLKAGRADIVMFLQGAAGDLKQGARVGDKAGWIAEYEATQILGHRLAQAVIEQLDKLAPVEGPLRAVAQTVTAPLQAWPAPDEAILLPENQHVTGAMMTNWAAVVEHVHGGGAQCVEYELSSVALGQVLFVNIPGEPVSQLADRISQLNGRHEIVFTLGYTNGLKAYFPTDDMVEEKGYESHGSAFVYLLPAPFEKGVENNLLKAAYENGLAVLPPVDAPPASPIQDHDHRAFFVLSTGRSGTQTLAQLLKMAGNAKVWHHPQPYMIQETLDAYWDISDRRSTFWAGRGHIVRSAWDHGLIHGETDHNMTPFCDVIAEDIPNSRFVVLVRDPREFVRSGMRRGYYRGSGEWEDGRLRPHPDDPNLDEWLELPQFDQVCWLWAETYRHIEKLKTQIGENRVMVVRFEDLISGPEATRKLFDFVGLDGYDESYVREVLGQKLNAQRVGEFPHPAEWTEEMHAVCWSLVGDLAERYGYPMVYPKRKAQLAV